MAVKVRIRNFQAIEDAEIVVDRFTAVTGPNNSGKTASIRSVLGAFSNAPGDSYVRHGADKLTVDVLFADGHELRWEKGPKVKPTYIVDGKTFHPGRAVPDEVRALGVQPIQAGTLTLWPQIAPQFTGQVFLLDLPGSTVAEAVADVDRVGKLTQALTLAESDKRAAAIETKLRKKDLATSEARLQRFAGLDTTEALVEATEKLEGETKILGGQMSTLQGLSSKLKGAKGEVEGLAGVESIVLPDVVVTDKARKYSTLRHDLGSLRKRHVAAEGVISAVAGIEQIKVPELPPKVFQVREARRKFRSYAQQWTQLQGVLKKDEWDVVAKLGLTKPWGHVGKVKQVRGDLGFLQGIKSRTANLQTEMNSLQKTLKAKQGEVGSSDKEVNKILGGMGACPTCKGAITTPHVHP